MAQRSRLGPGRSSWQLDWRKPRAANSWTKLETA